MNMHGVARTRVRRALHQMLLHGLAPAVGVGVERHEPLGLRAVAKPAFNYRLHYILVRRAGFDVAGELGIEGEFFDILQQGVDALAAAAVVHELEQLLEHSRGGSRGGYELHDFELFRLVVVTGFGPRDLLLGQYPHSVARRRGAHYAEIGKSRAEILDLSLDSLRSEPVFLDLL